jgi:RimJ/RimL family protein N-acetyltransferase
VAAELGAAKPIEKKQARFTSKLGNAWWVIRRVPKYFVMQVVDKCVPGFGASFGAAVFTRTPAVGVIGLLGTIAAALVSALGKSGQEVVKQTIEMTITALRSYQNDVLLMTRLVETDLEDLAAAIDDVVVEEMGFADFDPLTYQAYLTQPEVFPYVCAYVVRGRSTGELLGEITLHSFNPRAGSAELGWWMAASARGQGFGKLAMKQALVGFHSAGIKHILIGTAVTNLAVQHVVRSLGGVLLQESPHQLPNGNVIESHWYLHSADA